MSEDHREAGNTDRYFVRIRRRLEDSPALAAVVLFLVTALAAGAAGAAVTAGRGPVSGLYAGEQSASISGDTAEILAGRLLLREWEQRPVLPVQLEITVGEMTGTAGEGTADTVEYALSLTEKKREALDLLRASSEVPEGDALWKAFSDSVILGDSRVAGFSVYHFLPEKRVLAEISSTVKDVDNYLDTLGKMAPRRIYLSYGINDIAIFPSLSAEEYADLVITEAGHLREKCPDAVICINSILPAQQAALDRGPIWERIPSYSEAIRKRCEKEGYCYIDNTALAEQHKDLYGEDGVHMVSEFYPFWAQNMLSSAQVYEARRLLEEGAEDE